MKKILLTLAMLVLAMGAGALTLEECVLRGSSPRGIGAMQPSKSDGRYFYRLSDDGNAIMRISYAKGDESVLVAAPTSCCGTTRRKSIVTVSAPTTTSMISRMGR